MALGKGREGPAQQSCQPFGSFWEPLLCFWGNTSSVTKHPLPLPVMFGSAGTTDVPASVSILGSDEDTLSHERPTHCPSPVVPEVGVFVVGRGRSLLLQPLRFLYLL